MKTRSQTRKEEIEVVELVEENTKSIYSVDIDFDEASRAWNANKKRLPNGEYRYIRERRVKPTQKV